MIYGTMIYLLMALLLCVVPVDAKNLYVNGSTGNDSTPYANNDINNPWLTLGRAAWGHAVRASANSAQAAQAGDVVYVAAGTYSAAGQNARHNSAYNPVNSGTAGNYISFQATGTVNLQLSSGTGPVIGCDSINYVKWIGFSIDEQFATPYPDTGPAVANASTGCWFERNTIVGYQYGHNRGDNHNGIRFEACTDCYAGQNTISNIYTCISTGTCNGDPPVNLRNGACIMIYSGRNITMEHNDISACGTGVYVKGTSSYSQYGYVIRLNLFHDLNWGVVMSNLDDPLGAASSVYQNIVRNCVDRGIAATSDVSSIYNVSIYSNTVNACELNIGMRNAVGSGVSFTNNLSTNAGAGTGQSFSAGEATSHTSWSANYNMYFGADRWSYNGANYTSLPTWRTAISDEANSTVQDPLYVNAGANNFHLQAGSPALTASDIGGPVGAYITGNETIGVESAAGPAPRFVPGLLRVAEVQP